MDVKTRVDELAAIKGRKEGRRLSRRQIAEETGLSLSSVQNWASNNLKRFDALQIAVFCQYFGVTPNELFIIEIDEDDAEGQQKALLATA